VNMLPGSQALRSIEQSLSEAKRDLEATNGQIAKVSSTKAELQHEESAAYRELAGLRLDVLARDTVVQDLDASERKARSLLEDHQAALAALEAEIASGVKSGESLQRQRAELVERLETLGGQIDEAEAKTQSRLAAPVSVRVI
jgi:chromosome segregation ATPase